MFNLDRFWNRTFSVFDNRTRHPILEIRIQTYEGADPMKTYYHKFKLDLFFEYSDWMLKMFHQSESSKS